MAWIDDIDRKGYSGSAKPAGHGLQVPEVLQIGLSNFPAGSASAGGAMLANIGNSIKLNSTQFLFSDNLDYRRVVGVNIVDVTDNDVNFPSIPTATFYPQIESRMLPLELPGYDLPKALNLFGLIVDVISHIPVSFFDGTKTWVNDVYTYNYKVQCAGNFEVSGTYTFRLDKAVSATSVRGVTMSLVQWWVRIQGLGSQSAQYRNISLQTNRYSVRFTNEGRLDVPSLSMVNIIKTAPLQDAAPSAATDPIDLAGDAVFPTSIDYTNNGNYFTVAKGSGTDASDILLWLNGRVRDLVADGRGREFMQRWLGGFIVSQEKATRSVIVSVGDAFRTADKTINLGIASELIVQTNGMDLPSPTDPSDIYSHSPVMFGDIFSAANLMAGTNNQFVEVAQALMDNPQMTLPSEYDTDGIKLLNPIAAFFTIVAAGFDILAANLSATPHAYSYAATFASASFNVEFYWSVPSFAVTTGQDASWNPTITIASDLHMRVKLIDKLSTTENPKEFVLNLCENRTDSSVFPASTAQAQIVKTTNYFTQLATYSFGFKTSGPQQQLIGLGPTLPLAADETFSATPVSEVWETDSGGRQAVLTLLREGFTALASQWMLFEGWFGIFWASGQISLDDAKRSK
jgi:hypothetical protein